jgi:hypothetical protein
MPFMLICVFIAHDEIKVSIVQRRRPARLQLAEIEQLTIAQLIQWVMFCAVARYQPVAISLRTLEHYADQYKRLARTGCATRNMAFINYWNLPVNRPAKPNWLMRYRRQGCHSLVPLHGDANGDVSSAILRDQKSPASHSGEMPAERSHNFGGHSRELDRICYSNAVRSNCSIVSHWFVEPTSFPSGPIR